MSVLVKYFNKKIDQSSPLRDDYSRVVKIDKDGIEYITYNKVDYPEYQKSLGTVDLWSLDSMLKAGINPNIPIHTGLNTRLEGVDIVNDASAQLDALLDEAIAKDSE